MDTFFKCSEKLKETEISSISPFCRVLVSEKVSEYDQDIPQSKTGNKPVILWGRATQQSRDTINTKQSKATSSLFPIEMIAKLEWTQSNAQQNIEQLQNPTVGETINNESITTKLPPQNGQRPKPLGVLNAFYRTSCLSDQSDRRKHYIKPNYSATRYFVHRVHRSYRDMVQFSPYKNGNAIREIE